LFCFLSLLEWGNRKMLWQFKCCNIRPSERYAVSLNLAYQVSQFRLLECGGRACFRMQEPLFYTTLRLFILPKSGLMTV
jgi:hypothetical protein